MIQPLRAVHRKAFVVLAIALPVVFWAGLREREAAASPKFCDCGDAIEHVFTKAVRPVVGQAQHPVQVLWRLRQTEKMSKLFCCHRKS